MIPVSPQESARERLAAAAQTLEDFQAQAGLPAQAAAPPRTNWRPPVETVARQALDSARARVVELEAELEETRRTLAKLEAENRSLRQIVEGAQAAVAEAEEKAAAEARAQAFAEARAELLAERPAAEAHAAAVQGRLEEQVMFLEAECARQESLRRKAEADAVDARAAAHSIEESLRRELKTAHTSLDRAAVDSGAVEARAQEEIHILKSRLEAATARLEGLDREKRLESARGTGESEALQTEIQRARAVAAALRQETVSIRAEADRREEALRKELTAVQTAFDEAKRALRERAAALERASAVARTAQEQLAMATAEAAAPESPDVESLGADLPPSHDDLAIEPPSFVQPPIDPVLDPGWARLLRLVRPHVEAAYAHLRRLSAAALTGGQKTLLRLAAASIAQASDSLFSIELALEEGPAPGAPASVLTVLEPCLAAWEPAFRRRAVALTRELPSPLPETAYAPKALRVLFHQVLRNALEALPRGSRLTIRGTRGPDGALRLEFADDGPGFPQAWLERRFEPFASPRRGRAGLGLSLVRRTLRRWGGDAEAANGPGGRGARLTMIFAPPPGPEMPSPR